MTVVDGRPSGRKHATHEQMAAMPEGPIKSLLLTAPPRHDYPACAVFRGGKCTCDEAVKLSAVERLRNGGQPDLADQVDTEIRTAYAEGRKDEADENGATSRLIDAWVVAHGRPVPWEKAVEIVAIVNKLPDAERAQLLALADETPSPTA